MRRLLPVLLLGVAASSLGCGRSPEFVMDRDGVLRFGLSEYRIEPQNLRVREGRIRIVATNEGRLTHNVQIESIEDREGEQPTRYGRTETMQPGEVERTTVTLGPGKYRIVCTIGNHDDLGQYGELQVLPRQQDRAG